MTPGEKLKSLLSYGGPIEVVGPTACGKHKMVLDCLNDGKYLPVVFNISSGLDYTDLIGAYRMREEGLVYVEAALPVALRQEGVAVIIEDYDLLEKGLFEEQLYSLLETCQNPVILIRTDLDATEVTVERFRLPLE